MDRSTLSHQNKILGLKKSRLMQGLHHNATCKVHIDDQGTYFFLAKCKKVDKPNFKNLSSNFKTPECSELIMTLNVFMIDDAWLEIVLK